MCTISEIVLTISVQQQEYIDENNESPTYGQMIKKGILFIELCDTGIGINPEYIQHIWESFSQGDMSITKGQDGAGLGLSICKSLVEINGGEIKAESLLGKGKNKLYVTLCYKKLIVHSIESVRNSLLKYLKKVEKVDAFDTFDKEEVINAVLELKKLEINNNNLAIIFIAFQSDRGIKLAELIE
ncbi:5951_t:CDS:2, partial [Racocetra persica]